VRATIKTNGSDCGVYASAFLFEWATMSANANLNVKLNVPQSTHAASPYDVPGASACHPISQTPRYQEL